MKDFVKIFLSLVVLVAVFLTGRNYGEKTYLESHEHRAAIRATEELNFTKAEFENVKIKLQNITDAAGILKAEDLLTQIFHIFLTDLGLKIQNKDAIIKRAEAQTPLAPYPEPAGPLAPPKKAEPLWSKTNSKTSKLKSYEWMLQNSGGPGSKLGGASGGTLGGLLKKLQIKNLKNYLAAAEDVEINECRAYLGTYKGIAKNINGESFGAIGFELKAEPTAGDAGASGTAAPKEFLGKISWYNNGHAVSKKFSKYCGKKNKDLDAKIFSLSADKYLQIYKLMASDHIAGNFYQTSPNGTTTRIGSFVLIRIGGG